MNPFNRSTLLIAQYAAGLVTHDEVRVEMQTLIPQMAADPSVQPQPPTPYPPQPPVATPYPQY